MFGVDRTLPLTPVTSSYNVFDTSMKSKMDSSNTTMTSQERKGPLAPTVSKEEHLLRPPSSRTQQPGGKGGKNDKYAQSSLVQHKSSHKAKIKPYIAPPTSVPESKPQQSAANDNPPKHKKHHHKKPKLRQQETAQDNAPLNSKSSLLEMGKSLSIPAHLGSSHSIRRSSSADVIDSARSLRPSENSAFSASAKTQNIHSHTHKKKSKDKKSSKNRPDYTTPSQITMPTTGLSDNYVTPLTVSSTVIDSSSIVSKHSHDSRSVLTASVALIIYFIYLQ